MAQQRFSPYPCIDNSSCDALRSKGIEWVPVCACPAGFALDVFDAAVSQLVAHPEYNSTLILRSEIIQEKSVDEDTPVLELEGLQFARNIYRKLLPRRPGRDPPVNQNCTFYSNSHAITCLVLSPRLDPDTVLPWYHPAVYHLAFRYIEDDQPTVRIEVVTRPDAPDPLDVNARLYRTCLALLETVHRYGKGISTNYRKRVHHDCLVSREEYQDLYLVMRERYKHLVNTWHENTDPLKHVFEDIGIATYLMLLWKQNKFAASLNQTLIESEKHENRGGWSQPPGGFLDLGCGNGLLVHILLSEGYVGNGIDIRARNSWKHYPPDTQKHLHVHALDPLQTNSSPYLREGTFIIANHADELSPWTPVLAAMTDASGFISIPCCAWSFDTRFHRSQLLTSGESLRSEFAFGPPDGLSFETYVESLRLGGDAGANNWKSAYASYRIWLASINSVVGWEIETDTLRIPSTRNWAIVGRSRSGDSTQAINNATSIIQKVQERGLFKTRVPEGKTHH